MTSDHIDIQRRTLPVQCPACRDHLGAGPAVSACASCQTPHHLACLAEIGCASLQCRPYGPAASADDSQVIVHHDDLSWIILDSTWSDLVSAREPSMIQVTPQMRFVSHHGAGDALDDVASYLQEYAPGLLAEPEYPDDVDARGVCAQCRADLGDDASEPCQHVEDAEAALICCDMGLWLEPDLWMAELSGDLRRQVLVDLFERELNEQVGDDDVLGALMHERDDLRTYCGCQLADDPAVDDDAHTDDCEGVLREIRLQVRQIYGGMSVSLRAGDPSYDQDHRGWWGASSIGYSDTDEDLERTLDDLVDRVCDAYADGMGG